MFERGGLADVDAREDADGFADVAAQALELEFIFGDGVPLDMVLAGRAPEEGVADGGVGFLRVGFEGLKPGPDSGAGKVDGGGTVEDHAEGVDSGGAPGGVGGAGIEE